MQEDQGRHPVSFDVYRMEIEGSSLTNFSGGGVAGITAAVCKPKIPRWMNYVY